MILILKLALALILIFVVYLAGAILYAQLKDYHPDEVTPAEVLLSTDKKSTIPDSLTLFTWNIGYAGLGKASDFFYDGGKMVRSSEEQVKTNFEGIKARIAEMQSADFILLQEVDRDAKRSYGIQQAENIAKQMQAKGFTEAYFATNYLVPYVPIPLTEPMGRVHSGLLTLSKYKSSDIKRYAFPANFSWPKGLFFLDRCFMVQRYPLKGKELLVVNTHNSAFDGGTLKKQEMDFMKTFLLEEYRKGNYIIVGGDWNQIPPGYQGNPSAGYEEMPVPADYPAKAWIWASDLNHRSNRKVDTPFVKGVTYTTILDFYLLSPNIEVTEIKGLVYDFEHSDHQPVQLKIKFK